MLSFRQSCYAVFLLLRIIQMVSFRCASMSTLSVAFLAISRVQAFVPQGVATRGVRTTRQVIKVKKVFI